MVQLFPPLSLLIVCAHNGIGALLLAAVIVYCISYTVYIYGALRASRSLHKQLLESVLGTTLRYLYTLFEGFYGSSRLPDGLTLRQPHV